MVALAQCALDAQNRHGAYRNRGCQAYGQTAQKKRYNLQSNHFVCYSFSILPKARSGILHSLKQLLF
jgi:hypothetical protein